MKLVKLTHIKVWVGPRTYILTRPVNPPSVTKKGASSSMGTASKTEFLKHNCMFLEGVVPWVGSVSKHALQP